MRSIAIATIAIASLAGLSSCTGTPTRANADALTPRQMELLESHLGGKQAGQAVRCLPPAMRDATSIRVSDDVLLFRQNGSTVYRNDLRGSCPGLGRDDDIMVFRSFGTGPCSGDIFTLVDRGSGISGPSCVLGEFTPYRSPRN